MNFFFLVPDFQFILNFAAMFFLFFFFSLFVSDYLSISINHLQFLKTIMQISILFILISMLNFNIHEISVGFYSLKYTYGLNLVKMLLLVLSFIIIYHSRSLFFMMTYYLINFFEYFFFFFSFLLGLFLLLVSNSFMIFFFSIEVISFALYYLIISKNNKLIIVEAALKYFVFSLLASAFILQALILFYGFFGITCFFEIFIISSFFNGYFFFYYLFIISIFFLSLGFIFKLALAPLHFWSPDVLEITNYGIFIFFVLLTKMVYFIVFLRLLTSFKIFFSIFYFLLLLTSIYSMVVGILGSLFQTKIKRFLAYSSIFHGGLFLISVISNFFLSVIAFVFYFFYYIFFYLNFILFLNSVTFFNNRYYISNIYEMHLYKQNIYMSLCILIMLFFLMGIPPLVSFITKYVFIISLVFSNLTFLAFFFFFLSIIAVFYYLKIVRIFFFSKIASYSVYLYNYNSFILNVYLFYFLFFIFADYSELLSIFTFLFKIEKC